MLLDTSGLFCYHDQADKHHTDAVTLLQASPLLLTHSYVFAEFVALAQARRLPRLPALQFIADILANEDVEVVWVDVFLHRAALQFLQARLDKTYSLCDAVSFLLMQERGLAEALTTDHHFEQAGFRRLLK
jgi:predicted nucleic acid-binding protein